jgi:hypothetical protein
VRLPELFRADKKCYWLATKSSLAGWNFERLLCRDGKKDTGKKIRSSELAFAAPGLYPSQVLRQNRCYYESGPVVTGQAARTVATSVARTTASSYEQKERTPVWFGLTGFPQTL